MKQAPVLKDEQVKRLLKTTRITRHSARNRLVILLSYYVGLRACEIASLKVGDVVDGEGNIKDTVLLTKDMTKGSKANSVYLSEFVKKEIKKYLESNTERLVTLKSPLTLLSAHWRTLLFTDASGTVQDTLFKCRYQCL